MSEDDDLDQFLNCYSSSSTKSMFKEQVALLKTNAKSAIHSKTQDIQEMTAIIHENEDVTLTNNSSNVIDNIKTKTDNFDLPDEASNHSAGDECAAIVIDQEVCVPAAPRYNTRHSKHLRENYQLMNCYSDSVSDAECVAVVDLLEEESEVRENGANKTKKLKSRPRKRKEQKIMSKHDCILVSDEDPPVVHNEDVNFETQVKVIWKSTEIVKIPVRRMQKLLTVYEHFMQLENVSMDKILLKKDGVTVKPTDTPDSLNLTICDFLDGGIVSNSVLVENNTPKAEKGFTLKFQDSGKNVVAISCKPDEQLQMAMIRYAEQIVKPFSTIKFFFDGDSIKNSDTPHSLDMESGDVIDVIF